MTMEAMAEAHFSVFLSAADPQVGTASGDALDAIEVSVRKSLEAVTRVETVLAGCDGAIGFGDSCSPARMRATIWGHASARVANEHVRPFHVTVGNVHQHIARALIEDRVHSVDDILSSWSAAKIRRYFAELIGDPRERRITELRDKALHAIRQDRPEKRWTWCCGAHHTDTHSGYRTLQLTYCSDRVMDIDNVFRYIVHLATGADPLNLTLPPILGFNDGQKNWSRSLLFKRQLKPFAGVEWIRFTAGHSIEIGLCEDVLSRLQAHWDAAGFRTPANLAA